VRKPVKGEKRGEKRNACCWVSQNCGKKKNRDRRKKRKELNLKRVRLFTHLPYFIKIGAYVADRGCSHCCVTVYANGKIADFAQKNYYAMIGKEKNEKTCARDKTETPLFSHEYDQVTSLYTLCITISHLCLCLCLSTYKRSLHRSSLGVNGIPVLHETHCPQIKRHSQRRWLSLSPSITFSRTAAP